MKFSKAPAIFWRKNLSLESYAASAEIPYPENLSRGNNLIKLTYFIDFYKNVRDKSRISLLQEEIYLIYSENFPTLQIIREFYSGIFWP